MKTYYVETPVSEEPFFNDSPERHFVGYNKKAGNGYNQGVAFFAWKDKRKNKKGWFVSQLNSSWEEVFPDIWLKPVSVEDEVDEFLRCHPEYRCLDVIGKYNDWLKTT